MILQMEMLKAIFKQLKESTELSGVNVYRDHGPQKDATGNLILYPMIIIRWINSPQSYSMASDTLTGLTYLTSRIQIDVLESENDYDNSIVLSGIVEDLLNKVQLTTGTGVTYIGCIRTDTRPFFGESDNKVMGTSSDYRVWVSN
jgi:hypothetical protein